MRLVVCLFLFLIPTLNYGFKKNNLPYSIVILKADLIVDGTISKVSKDKYEFTINEFVKGKSDIKIKVSIWKEWQCDARIKELKKGQRLILLLEKLPNGNFYPINESTGELFVDNNAFPDIFLPKEFSNPIILKEGILMFLQTYTLYGFSNDRFLQKFNFVRNKSVFEIYKMTKTNTVFRFLVDDVEYYKPMEIQQLFY